MSSPLCMCETRKRYVVKHNLITEVYLMTVMETTTCFGLYWPSSGCLGKRSVLVRCLFGVDVWNFQEVRLIDAVVFMNWRWTSHQHWSLHSTQEAASNHTPLNIWDSAIITTERRIQPTDIWMTSNVYLTRTSHHSLSSSSAKRGHIPSTYDERPLIHREVPNPRP